MRSQLLALVVAALLVSACAPAANQPAQSNDAPESAIARDTIVVPLSLHVMVEQGNPESELSSMRTPEDLAEIAANMAAIWKQADVTFDPITTQRVEVPRPVLESLLLGSTDLFFDQVNTTFAVENSQAINGFYLRSSFGVNGFTPQGSNLFFVVDDPSVPDERVSSHEVGHIFGLRHDLDDATQLMFSGTNGTGLSMLEQTVSRYTIEGIFPQG